MTTDSHTSGGSADCVPVPAGTTGPASARFLADRSEAAFAAVVGEHGRMVYGVCRRVLGNQADAEDAFQATFLVLARDAAAVVRRGIPVGAWLYGTAYRLALFARRTAARRAARDLRQAKPMATPAPPSDDADTREAERLLDDELHRLPDRYQRPVVLCYLGGLTHDQAADQIGVHPRTLERRLKAGLELLRSRLVVRGVSLSAAALAVLLTATAARAAVPPPLAQSTAAAAAKVAAGSSAAAAGGSVAVLVNGVRFGQLLTAAAWGGGLAVAAAVAVAGGWYGFAGGNGRPKPPPPVFAEDEPPVVSGAGERNGPAGRNQDVPTVTVRGRVVGPDGRPLAGVPVALLARPVRLDDRSGKSFTPLDDPLSDVGISKGRFRALARGVTDATGRYELTGVQQVPDPTTRAMWYQTLPWAFVDGPHRLLREPAEFKNLQIIPLGR